MVFPYFGSKGHAIRRYPAPRHQQIVEPFCGSAWYSRTHFRGHDVWLNDIDPMIYGMWKYLQKTTRRRIEEIFREELYPHGTDRRDLKGLCQEEKDLLGFAFHLGSQQPANGRWSSWSLSRRNIDNLRRRILAILDAVPSWRVTNLAHDQLPDVVGTWFVDAPYQCVKRSYRYNCVHSYAALAEWCQSRRGLVIVCEGPGATWLPFKKLDLFHGNNGLLKEEMFWVKDDGDKV